MAWPTTAVATGDLITAAQLNGLPVMIANSTLSADAANIDFTSIPGHYAHLMLVCYLRGDAAATGVDVMMRFNNDSAANYDWQRILGNAATASAFESFAATSAELGTVAANTGTANVFGAITVTIPHYANAANNKAAVSEFADKRTAAAGNLLVGSIAQFWRSNSAINRVTILPLLGNFRSGSRVTLYGIA